MNEDYQGEEFAPGFLAFGPSGGGKILAFNTNGRAVMIPMIEMSANEAVVVANSRDVFIEKIEK
jgi:hypothetical protein